MAWILKKRSRRFRSSTGWGYTYRWEGLGAELNAFLASLEPGYVDIDIEEDITWEDAGQLSGMCAANVTYATAGTETPPGVSVDGLVIRRWTMPFVGEDVHILACDSTNLLRAADSRWVGNILDYVERYRVDYQQAVSGEEASWPEWDPSEAEPSGIDEGLAATLRPLALTLAEKLRDNPDDTVPISVPTLRKVEVVLNSSTLKASITDLDRAFTWTALLAREPSLATAPLIDRDVLVDWHWVKTAPTLDEMAGDLNQITQVWNGVKAVDTFKYKAIITS